ncbi:ALIX V-shaped domain-containing protein [Cynara cardunculus var. scolymus]|uniref:ALIX V-shaped domain-containing protein n=1 Tax=Cynara cardunculus var. scolymus TaxID=59895 RepID=A0A103YAA6_CYNCS|nr:ALIX V-shaped domain-containing protein [Cynara cardunculus var. scolymus]
MAAPSSSSSATNIMLAIHEKKTVSVDLYRPLRNYVVFNYSEREAQNLEDDLENLKEMRNTIERSSGADSLPSRRDLLQNYFKALTAVESRFPISPDKDHVNSVTFTWHDAFKNKNKASQQNIHLEKAAILFNLGAVHSQIGLTFDRSTVEGRRQASHSFIAAAGAFAFLRDNAATKASIGSSTTVDVSVECAGMLERLMLAQAQECVFENTIAKGSTPGVCAKISRQLLPKRRVPAFVTAGLYYEEAVAALNVAPLSQHFDKTWMSHIQLKAALFYAEACYRYSLELHEKDEIGEEIARLNSGISALSDAKKSSPRGAAQQILDAINKLESNLNCNLERAMKENDRVYLMRVPPASSLPPLPAFSLVKSMNMNDVLDASKEKMFASLVPDNSAKALSRYTEMVDEVIRTQAEKLQQGSELARTQAEKLQQGSELARVSLKEMDLPDSILALEGHSVLPTALWEDVEAVQISGGPAGLEGELQQLRDLRRVNHELLDQTEELLQKEAAEDAQFRSQFGTRWTRPQSSTLTKNLQDRLNRFAANLKQAADSDGKIERSVRDHMALMSILDSRPIESALPTLARPIMSLDANEDAVVGALKQSLRQLETLGAQRAGLEDMLKDMKRKDDILPKLMTSIGSHEDLFRKEIAKYDQICEDISQNLQAQEQLLLHIQAQNSEFAGTFNIEDYRASCEKCYKQIEAAIARYREIKENINEGLKFYVTLQEAITNVKQQSNDFVMTRSIQCREMIEDVQRQMSGLSVQDGRNYNYSVGRSHQSQRPEAANMANTPRPQTPYYQQPPPGYGQHPPPPYNTAPPSGGSPYPPQPGQQQGPPGQPAYPGWQGSYYNAQGQQPGSYSRPPYPPNQSGYYRQ